VRSHANENLTPIIESIRLFHFRNFERLDLSLHQGVNVFVGENGQGKTNLIEAIALAMNGSSFRPGRLDVLVRHGHGRSRIECQVKTAEGMSQIEVLLENSKKILSVNAKRISTNELRRRFPLVVFSPESLASIKDGPEQRRLLLDEVVQTSFPSESHTLPDFKRCLITRNRLLLDYKNGLYDESQVSDLLNAINEIYLPAAIHLTLVRIKALKALYPYLQEAIAFIFNDRPVDISVNYVISSESAWNWDSDEIAHSISNRLKSLRKSELESGISLVGPHKHDIQFLSAGNDARYFCSQGQQRGIILGFKMAQIMYHYSAFHTHPLLLLDDVLSELDPTRGHQLLKFLERIRSQILLTTTDIGFPFDFGAQGLAVRKLDTGLIQELRNP